MIAEIYIISNISAKTHLNDSIIPSRLNTFVPSYENSPNNSKKAENLLKNDLVISKPGIIENELSGVLTCFLIQLNSPRQAKNLKIIM